MSQVLTHTPWVGQQKRDCDNDTDDDDNNLA
jgi:hypothetical protein